MGWLSVLFGTPKVVGAVADTVKAGVGMLDNAFYTDQEKASNAIKFSDAWLQIQIATANENSIRSISRRLLAWAIMFVFLLLILAAAVLWGFDPKYSEFILKLISDTELGWLTVGVGIFYFGTFGVGTYLRKKKE